MELDRALRLRRSTRAYRPDAIPTSQVEEIVKAGQLAPIGMKKYDSIHLSVVTDAVLLEDIAEAGAQWGGIKASGVTYNVPVLIVVSTTQDDPSIPRDPSKVLVGLNAMNAACVIENMLLKATDLGISSVYLYSVTQALNANEELLQRLKVPQGFKVQASCALGYAASEENPQPKDPAPIAVKWV